MKPVRMAQIVFFDCGCMVENQIHGPRSNEAPLVMACFKHADQREDLEEAAKTAWNQHHDANDGVWRNNNE